MMVGILKTIPDLSLEQRGLIEGIGIKIFDSYYCLPSRGAFIAHYFTHIWEVFFFFLDRVATLSLASHKRDVPLLLG